MVSQVAPRHGLTPQQLFTGAGRREAAENQRTAASPGISKLPSNFKNNMGRATSSINSTPGFGNAFSMTSESLLKKTRVPLIAATAMVYNQITAAFFGIIFAKLLGAADFGIINLARSIFAVVIVLSPFGLDLALQRHIGGLKASAATIAAEVFWPRLFTFLISVIIVVGLLLGGADFLEQTLFQHTSFGIVFAVTMAALPFATDLGVLGGAYRGIGEPIPSLLANAVVQPTFRILLILALFPMVGGLRAVIYGTLLSFVIAWLYAAILFHRRLPIDFSELREALPAAKTIFRYAPLLGLGNFLFMIARSLDVLFLGHFSTTADVGRYAVVNMTGQLVGMVGISLGQTLGTNLAAAAAVGNFDKITKLLSDIMRLASLLSAPFCIAITVWGQDIDLLLGPSYQIPMAVFALVALTQWVVTTMNYGSWALVTTGRNLLELFNNILIVVVEAIACFLLVPRYGIVGAAAASFIALSTLAIARQLEVGLILKKRLVTIELIVPLLIAALVSVPLILIQHALQFRAWWLTGLLVIAHQLVSFTVTFVLFRKADPRLAIVDRIVSRVPAIWPR